ELAGLCASSGQKALARTLYEALDQECVSRQMDDWDPALSAACLEGLLTLTRGKDMTPADLASRARRLAVLDPVAALRAIS
ncbi:MAG TPA: type VI secretion system domain-containing protein, partial [Myxococcales bacterium]|nr:type VI secretion system domain-containing protein [Myxococcales bacterium]